jgi:hypothetical protein
MHMQVRATLTPRKKPKAKELNNKDRTTFTLSYYERLVEPDALPTLVDAGFIGEWLLVMEMGSKEQHHHGEAAFQVLSRGGPDEAVACIEAMLRAAMPEDERVTCYLGEQFVHDKGDDRTHDEAKGYALKDMPEQHQPSGETLPDAVQRKLYREPRIFWFVSNMPIERCRECILAYRAKNSSIGGMNFDKTNFTYDHRLHTRERRKIEPSNLQSWPVTHGRQHGFLTEEPSFLKLLCLMFEDDSYELSLKILGFGVQTRLRREALHRLNLNSGLAGTSYLMDIVLSGVPEYDEAKALYLTLFRAPWLMSEHVVENMDRAEWIVYLRDKRVPMRFVFIPRLPGMHIHT